MRRRTYCLALAAVMLAIPTSAAAGGVGTWTRVTDKTVQFTTKDAGAPLANSRVSVAGKSCTTNSNGACSIELGPYEKRKRLKAKATHSDYKPAKRKLRVTR